MIEYIQANSIGFSCIGAAIAIGLCGIASGLCEGGIGKAVIDKGAMEKAFGKGLILTTIGESIVICGFVIATMIVVGL